MKRFFIVFLSICIFTIFSQGAFCAPSKSGTTFEVSRGQSVFSIGGALQDAHLISSQIWFFFLSFVSGNFQTFRPGVYEIASGESAWNIIKVLSQGPQEKTVLIPPGATLKEIDDLLRSEDVLKSSDSLDISPTQFVQDYPFLSSASSLEGFLMPDTYSFYLQSSSNAVIRTMLDNFSRKTKKIFTQTSSDSIFKTVIVASLLEKEVVSARDRALVAGIIQNRLAKKMPLQIDASVVYYACGKRFSPCGSVGRDAFADDNEYNTYTRKTLPVAPISNPSLSALSAALHPESSSFLYYLSHPETGETFFSSTFAQHNIYRERYLKK